MSFEDTLSHVVEQKTAPVIDLLKSILSALQLIQSGQAELLAVPEACRRVRGSDGRPIGEATMWRWIRAGHVDSKKVGKRTFVVAASLAPIDQRRIAELVARARPR